MQRERDGEAKNLRLNDDREKTSILKIPPRGVRERVLWDFDGFKSCEQLVSWIKAKVRITTSWKPGGTDFHAVDELDKQASRSYKHWAATRAKRR